jgi:deoxyribonuclease V
MAQKISHSWNLTPAQAIALQKELREKINICPLKKDVSLIGGADISFNKASETVYAGIVVLSYPSLQVHAHSLVVSSTTFPYIPGLLSFRELPALLEALEQLDQKPDVLMVDGQGIAHPRRLGIATHFGLVADVPTLGCAKKVLIGKYKEPDINKGSNSSLMDGNEQIGILLRTKNNVKPVIISPGNLMDFEDAKNLAIHCTGRYRLPEPTRHTHLLVNRLRLGEVKPGVMYYNKQIELF